MLVYHHHLLLANTETSYFLMGLTASTLVPLHTVTRESFSKLPKSDCSGKKKKKPSNNYFPQLGGKIQTPFFIGKDLCTLLSSHACLHTYFFSLTNKSHAPGLDVLSPELWRACYFVSFRPLLKTQSFQGPPDCFLWNSPFSHFCTSLLPTFIYFHDKYHSSVKLCYLFAYLLCVSSPFQI